jgi:hypothetical protein
MTLEELEANSRWIRSYIYEIGEFEPNAYLALDLMTRVMSALVTELSSQSLRLAEIETHLSTCTPGSQKQSEKPSTMPRPETFQSPPYLSW